MTAATQISSLINNDRARLHADQDAQLPAIRLFEILPSHPVLTVPKVCEWLKVTKPTANKAIQNLARLGILQETTGKQRDRVYGYQNYMQLLTMDRFSPRYP